MIVVTGGAGFIGSNIVKSLNERGRKDILVVDNLQDGTKFRNLVDCEILDYIDQDVFLRHIDHDEKYLATVEAIFHEGACSSTTEWDGRFMMENNYAYTKKLLHFCLNKKIQFIYASSASVYGGGSTFKEDREHESPLNVYGYSKFLFDQYVRRLLINVKSQVVGLRYFNVYGPREQHKGAMASVAFHFNRQLLAERKVKLFQGSDGYQHGEQRRDFIYVGDVADINLFFLDHPDRSGIFNAGTGRSQSFNDVARAVISYHGFGDIEYVPFPENLKGHYQSFTQSDISSLRHAGYQNSFKSVEEGVLLYMHWLNTK